MTDNVPREGGKATLTFDEILHEMNATLHKVLPPDINQSALPYTGGGREIRGGLMQIQGLAKKAVDHLRAEPFFELTNRFAESEKRFGTRSSADRLAIDGEEQRK